MSDLFAQLYQNDFAIQANHPQSQKDDDKAATKAGIKSQTAYHIDGAQLLVDMSRNRTPMDWNCITQLVNDLTQELADSLELLLANIDYWENPRSNEAVAARKIARSMHNLNDYFAGGFDHE